MKKLSKDKINGILGTVCIHLLVLLLLYSLVLQKPEIAPEKGLEVMMGVDIENIAKADINEVPHNIPKPVPAKPATPSPEEPLITQDEEESLVLPSEDESKKKKQEKPEKTQEQLQKEKEEAERKERERKEEEAKAKAASSIANAFTKGDKMSKVGNAEKNESASGAPHGNSNMGQNAGEGISFSLEGRDVGGGGLIRPKYDVQASGRVVVDITVTPAGKVIVAEVNLKKTNTADPKLRDAAKKAARSTVFNSIGGLDNQRGTITYNFELTQ